MFFTTNTKILEYRRMATREKVSVMHYLGINFSSRFQMALYDNVTFMTKDSFGHRGFDVLYLNPLIFIRPLEFVVGSLTMPL